MGQKHLGWVRGDHASLKVWHVQAISDRIHFRPLPVLIIEYCPNAVFLQYLKHHRNKRLELVQNPEALLWIIALSSLPNRHLLWHSSTSPETLLPSFQDTALKLYHGEHQTDGSSARKSSKRKKHRPSLPSS
jgi:hypothetical protein